MSPYDESIPAPRWLLLFVLLAALAMIGSAVIVAMADDVSGVGQVVLAIVLAAAGLGMLFVVRTFSSLRIRVSGDGVEFGFRSLGKTLEAGQIISAEPERYPWVRYGGWGIRISTGGYRAYSQAFERESVVIHAADQHSYHVTSRHPVDLAEAINHVATAETASP